MRLATQFFSLLDDLEELFGRRVDLLEESAVQNSRLQKSIAATSVTLYAA
jgi:predicted nucleotidyltransferase